MIVKEYTYSIVQINELSRASTKYVGTSVLREKGGGCAANTTLYITSQADILYGWKPNNATGILLVLFYSHFYRSLLTR